MIWDLRRALLKKEELESARLMDFEFRQRARAVKRLARSFGMREEDALQTMVESGVDHLIAKIAYKQGLDSATVTKVFAEHLEVCGAELRLELGDPTPHKLG